jgi:SAM-dependent methyltransferase
LFCCCFAFVLLLYLSSCCFSITTTKSQQQRVNNNKQRIAATTSKYIRQQTSNISLLAMHYTVWVSLTVFYRLADIMLMLCDRGEVPSIDTHNTRSLNIVEVGSYSFDGLTAASVFQLASHSPYHEFPSFNVNYTGVDLIAGPNVDVVVEQDKELPFPDNSVDIIISTSAFEHDQMFWLTFLDFLRILKPNGLLFLQAPSAGVEHRTPTDNWRFYRDAPYALEQWGRRSGYDVEVAVAHIHNSEVQRKVSLWDDHSMIFRKQGGGACSSDTVKTLWEGFGAVCDTHLQNPALVRAYLDITGHNLFSYEVELDNHGDKVTRMLHELAELEWNSLLPSTSEM